MRTGPILAMVTVMLAGAASSRADDCDEFVTKARPIFEELVKQVSGTYDAKEQQRYLEACRSEREAKSDPRFPKNMKCVLAAKDLKAIQTCWNTNYGTHFGEPKKPEPIEAAKNVDRLRKNMIAMYTATSEYTKGKAGPTPAGKACCKQKDQRCAAGDWTDPVWTDLEFEPYGPTQFQYTYKSDGTSATVTAVGDIECDGKLETYTLTMTAKNGAAKAKLVEPPAKKTKK